MTNRKEHLKKVRFKKKSGALSNCILKVIIFQDSGLQIVTQQKHILSFLCYF